MFLLQPIVICTVLLFLGIFLFNKFLIKEHLNYTYGAVVSVSISILLFLTQYTDRWIDATVVIIILIVSGLIMLIPCYMVYKEMKHYRLVYIVTHILAFTLLAGIRTVILISNPYYYVIPFMCFTSLYVFRNTEDKIKAFAMVGILLLIRFSIVIDYYPPLELQKRSAFASFVQDSETMSLTQSKPVIRGVDYFESHYPDEVISAVRSIHREDDIVVLIVYDYGHQNQRLIYKDNQIRDY